MPTVAVTGSSGLIGTALVDHLRGRGDRVIRLVRPPAAGPDDVSWDPVAGTIAEPGLDGVDAVVNLAGAGIADKRWSDARKRIIVESRVGATRTVAHAIAASGRPIRLVSGSAIGFYGNRGDTELTEESAAGSGFTTEVVLAWEAAAQAAVDAGAPVAYSRTGLVLAPQGGAMARLLPLARLGLAGPLGNGRQWWPWITLSDTVRALTFLVDHPEITGPVNVVGPAPARLRDLVGALGRALHRPALLPAPAFALRIALGEFADEVLDSHRVLPQRLTDVGFRFDQPTLDEAMAWLVSPGGSR